MWHVQLHKMIIKRQKMPNSDHLQRSVYKGVVTEVPSRGSVPDFESYLFYLCPRSKDLVKKRASYAHYFQSKASRSLHLRV